MLAKTHSAAIIGVEGYPVEVEADAPGRGDQDFVAIVGLPDAAVKESRDRIRAAMRSAALNHPRGMTVVNLAPADLRKEGASFDLAIAAALLAAGGSIPRDAAARTALLGELALDGTVRPVKGALSAAMAFARCPEVQNLLVPRENAPEAAFAAGDRLNVYPVSHLLEAVAFFQGKGPAKMTGELPHIPEPGELPDFCDVKGQAMGRRAMEIAAAGGHNVLLFGPPGTGKSMLASRLPSILPPMSREELLETSRIYSVLGLLTGDHPLCMQRPFRSPHHTISDVGLIGGGRDPRPGEISLAHNGVLFLDELPEFKRNVLEVLRQPLESGLIHVSRASGSAVFPARFMLVAAMNPCPCGRGDAELGCRCKVDEKRRYLRKVSGPLLDRIDLHVPVNQLKKEELLRSAPAENSSAIRERVFRARQIQRARHPENGVFCNALMTPGDLRKYCALSPGGQALLRQAIDALHLSPRSYDRILKVSRTIADLAGAGQIQENHLLEAAGYRSSALNGEGL